MNRYIKDVSVLFVCLGNICRSPSAEGVFRQLAQQACIEEAYDFDINVDSAGTASWHIGNQADSRSIAAAKERGYDLSAQRCRQVTLDDFSRFDYILAMDANNLSELQKICPDSYTGVLALFLNYAQHYSLVDDVPDPYHGTAHGFEYVLDLVEDASGGLLQDIRLRFACT